MSGTAQNVHMHSSEKKLVALSIDEVAHDLQLGVQPVLISQAPHIQGLSSRCPIFEPV